MNELTLKRLKNYFSIYYKNFNYEINGLKNREIAFSPFDGSSMMRHVSFSDQNELKNALTLNPPRHFFYSSAYYENPTDEDLSETWIGADLIFDIDADHIQNADKMTKREMLGAVKGEVKKLIFLLENDFGVEEKNMELVFSGSRGYHIHVYDLFTDLNAVQRREIVDYITGRCLTKLKVLKKSRWEDRVKYETEKILTELKDTMKNKKETIYEGERFQKYKGFPSASDAERIRNIAIGHVVRAYGSAIDEPVTFDVHRLIRTPMSLHGKSGLIASILKFDDLESFDPFEYAVPNQFKEVFVNVKVLRTVKDDFTDKEERISEGVQKMPLHKAIYFSLSGDAEFLE